jgi:hypothetical protein
VRFPWQHRGEAGAMERIDRRAHARVEAEGGDEGLDRLGSIIRGSIGQLFGRAVADALFNPLEYAHERWHDSVRLYEELVQQLDDTISRERIHKGELIGALAEGALAVQARYAKARKPLPDDLRQFCIRAGTAIGWEFVIPPDDPQHSHHYDSAGFCANPLCRESSALEEPF